MDDVGIDEAQLIDGLREGDTPARFGAHLVECDDQLDPAFRDRLLDAFENFG